MQSAAAASLRQNDSLGRKDQRQKRGNESESDHHGIARRDTQLERDSKRFEDDPAPICFQKDRARCEWDAPRSRPRSIVGTTSLRG